MLHGPGYSIIVWLLQYTSAPYAAYKLLAVPMWTARSVSSAQTMSQDEIRKTKVIIGFPKVFVNYEAMPSGKEKGALKLTASNLKLIAFEEEKDEGGYIVRKRVVTHCWPIRTRYWKGKSKCSISPTHSVKGSCFLSIDRRDSLQRNSSRLRRRSFFV